MEKIHTKIRMSNELHHRIPANIREQAVKSQIIQEITKKIIDNNLVSITETKEFESVSYEASFLIIQEEEYHNLINEINKLKQTIDMVNFAFEKHIKQIGEIFKNKTIKNID